MNLGKKLAAGLLVAGTMTGIGLSIASPAGAATSVSATVPQASFPRWVNFGFYPDENSCANAGRQLLKEGSDVGDWRCKEVPDGQFLLQLLITPP